MTFQEALCLTLVGSGQGRGWLEEAKEEGRQKERALGGMGLCEAGPGRHR